MGGSERLHLPTQPKQAPTKQAKQENRDNETPKPRFAVVLCTLQLRGTERSRGQPAEVQRTVEAKKSEDEDDTEADQVFGHVADECLTPPSSATAQREARLNADDEPGLFAGARG